MRTGPRAAVTTLVMSIAGAVAFFCDLPSASAEKASAIQPEAIKALTSMGENLRALKSFILRADTTQDDALDNGQTIQISGHVTYQVQAPDKLTLEIDNDRLHRIFYYDGKTVTQFAPDLKMYAVFDAPSTIGKTIELAKARYGISLPIADLFYAGTDDNKIRAISSAALVGTSVVDGKVCNHYAYRLPRVDFQLWIRAEGDPLPCELVVTDTTDPSRPRNGAVIAIENVANFPDGTFAFVPPEGAEKIDVEPVKGVTAGSN